MSAKEQPNISIALGLSDGGLRSREVKVTLYRTPGGLWKLATLNGSRQGVATERAGRLALARSLRAWADDLERQGLGLPS